MIDPKLISTRQIGIEPGPTFIGSNPWYLCVTTQPSTWVPANRRFQCCVGRTLSGVRSRGDSPRDRLSFGEFWRRISGLPRRPRATLATILVLLTSCASVATPGLPSLASAIHPSPSGTQLVEGPIGSPGGPFLFDNQGRVVLFHGVNAVYKHAPYELYPAPGRPWNFSVADASLIARLGFNVVRLGMTWKGLEPGSAPANDPAICAKGTPHDPQQFSQSVLDDYLAKLKETVALLAKFNIYTILDMHQDVYNEMFDGEGAPNWAVCTSGVTNVDPPGRWSKSYATAAAGTAYRHFWRNDVVGDLQGEYDRVWGAVAAYFSGDPWILGFDPFNEPFSTALVRSGDEKFDGQLECFYTGRQFVGAPAHGAPPIKCPKDVPLVGLIPTIRKADGSTLIFYEPDIYGSRGYPNFVGPMNFSNLVFNIHVYCGQRSGKTGNPTDISACASSEQHALTTRSEDRTDLKTPIQPGGPAWFVSEFGATSNSNLLATLTDATDRNLVGWTYWAWKFYGDPTGSSAEGLVMPSGKLRTTASVLSRTYPQAIAGRPLALGFDPTSGAFHLEYLANHAVSAPTVIFVPTSIHYPSGYCARVSGGSVISQPGRTLLLVKNGLARTVEVNVTAGLCPS
jgi:endoglycosylceramidase